MNQETQKNENATVAQTVAEKFTQLPNTGKAYVLGYLLGKVSEEIFVKGDRLFVLFESACQKYIFGNLIRGTHIYSYELDS